MIITLVRHMETVSNSKGILQGSSDTPLSEKGLHQIQAFLDTVNLDDYDIVYSSELQRTKYFADKVSRKYNIPWKTEKRLNEIGLGEWEGKTWKEVTIQYKDFLTNWFKDNVNIPTPGGESYQEFQDRTMSFMDELADQNHNNVLVIAHGAVIKSIICKVLEMDLSNRSKLVIDNGSITKIEIINHKSRVLTINTKTVRN